MIILGLGSNIGNKEDNIAKALDQLKAFVTNIKFSKPYHSKALLPENAPKEWDIDFINIAVSGNTKLNPFELLKNIKAIEKNLDRIDRGFWSPREIDIDILAIDDLIIESSILTIPHKYLTERDFVLFPLSEIEPNWQHPVIKKTASQLWQDFIKN